MKKKPKTSKLNAMSTGWLVGDCDAATPDSRLSRPQAPTRYDESVPLPAFAVKT